MTIVVTNAVRQAVAPGSAPSAGDAVVLDDLTTWTLVPTDERHRTATFVWMYGRRYRYTAHLPRFALPLGWCVCPAHKGDDCGCREPTKPSASVAIILTGAKAITTGDQQLISTGDSYDTPLTGRPVDGGTWWPEAAARWRRVHSAWPVAWATKPRTLSRAGVA